MLKFEPVTKHDRIWLATKSLQWLLTYKRPNAYREKIERMVSAISDYERGKQGSGRITSDVKGITGRLVVSGNPTTKRIQFRWVIKEPKKRQHDKFDAALRFIIPLAHEGLMHKFRRCKICKSLFYPRRPKTDRCCSKECSRLYQDERRRQPKQQKKRAAYMIGLRAGQWKANQIGKLQSKLQSCRISEDEYSRALLAVEKEFKVRQSAKETKQYRKKGL